MYKILGVFFVPLVMGDGPVAVVDMVTSKWMDTMTDRHAGARRTDEQEATIALRGLNRALRATVIATGSIGSSIGRFGLPTPLLDSDTP
ncbi:MAG: hypothetical protein OXE86_17945 [Alphaproteobacteria bacterium]|nr:hypothetical protein [Alphaproteobacteria bacterium]